MMYYQSEVDEKNCPKECPFYGNCNYSPYVNRTYERWKGDKDEKVRITQWSCSAHFLWTVHPQDMLPYRSIPVPVLESYMDDRSKCGSDPPLREDSERGKGCLMRAWGRFCSRFKPIRKKLGQIIPQVSTPEELWIEMRSRIGQLPNNLSTILLYLKEHFNCSLLGDYKRCFILSKKSQDVLRWLQTLGQKTVYHNLV